METKTYAKTGFGLHDTRREIASRTQEAREAVEQTTMRHPKTGAQLLEELPPQPWQRTELKPLAA